MKNDAAAHSNFANDTLQHFATIKPQSVGLDIRSLRTQPARLDFPAQRVATAKLWVWEFILATSGSLTCRRGCCPIYT